MKTQVITLCVAMVFGVAAEASKHSSSCKGEQACCSPCQTVRWYKAKDGTYREMLPYMKALSRAEDADDMEPVLKQTQEELLAARADIESIQAQAAQVQSALEAQLADLKAQLEVEKQNVASQKERGDKAEAAQKQSVEQLAELQQALKKGEDSLATATAQVKTVSDERDALKTAGAALEKQVAELTAAKEAAEGARKKAEEALEKVKQEAAESKKAEVQEESAASENNDDNAGGATPPEAEPASDDSGSDN